MPLSRKIFYVSFVLLSEKIVLMFLEVVFQHIPDHGRTLAVARDDERPTVVAVLKVVVDGS
jgi:hypothetical protein